VTDVKIFGFRGSVLRTFRGAALVRFPTGTLPSTQQDEIIRPDAEV
jgi:hypothetical protein